MIYKPNTPIQDFYKEFGAKTIINIYYIYIHIYIILYTYIII